MFENYFAFNNKPIFFEILFSMYFICSFQKDTNKFYWYSPGNSRLFIFSFGKTSGISSFLLGLWENEYLFFFFTISESLLEINHSLILCNSLFTLRKISIYILGWVEKNCAVNKHNRFRNIWRERKTVGVEEKKERS